LYVGSTTIVFGIVRHSHIALHRQRTTLSVTSLVEGVLRFKWKSLEVLVSRPGSGGMNGIKWLHLRGYYEEDVFV
jgi:hypothetical protein